MKIKDSIGLVKGYKKIGLMFRDESIVVCYNVKDFYRNFKNVRYTKVEYINSDNCDIMFHEK